LGDQIPKELPGGYSECALLRVELHLISLKEIEGFAQMLEVICALHTFYQHVIHVYLHDVPDEILEDLVYHPL